MSLYQLRGWGRDRNQVRRQQKIVSVFYYYVPSTGHEPPDQRWASTLANRSNARHRSNIRAPHAPSPQMYMYPKCGNLCGQRVRKRFIASWGLRMSHICPCTTCPSPQGYRQRSKVVILPTTAPDTQTPNKQRVDTVQCRHNLLT